MLVVYPDAVTCRSYANALEAPGVEEFQNCLLWCTEQITRKAKDAQTVVRVDPTGICKGLLVYSLRGWNFGVGQTFFAFLVYKDTGSWAISPYIHGHPLTPPISHTKEDI